MKTIRRGRLWLLAFQEDIRDYHKYHLFEKSKGVLVSLFIVMWLSAILGWVLSLV